MKYFKLLWLISLIFILSGCTNPSHATEILKKEGYTDIKMTGYNFFACSDDDFFHTGFSAKKNGNKINGTVCSGIIFKNSTIRYK